MEPGELIRLVPAAEVRRFAGLLGNIGSTRNALMLEGWGILDSEFLVVLDILRAQQGFDGIRCMSLICTAVSDLSIRDDVLPRGLIELYVQMTHVSAGRIDELRRLRPDLRILR